MLFLNLRLRSCSTGIDRRAGASREPLCVRKCETENLEVFELYINILSVIK